MGGRKKKRTKSQASPDSVSETPAKRLTQSADQTVNQFAQNMASPQNTHVMSSAQQLQFPYCPPPNYPGQQLTYTPLTPMQQTPIQQNISSQPPSQPQSHVNSEFEKMVLQNFENLNNRLTKLDSIEKQLSGLTQKMTLMDNRVSSLESSSRATSNKLTEIEVSRAVDSQTCDEVRSKQATIDAELREERSRIQKLTSECESLKKSNLTLTDEVVDLQSRTMRDNLLFFGIPELHTAEERKSEKCSDVIHNHLDNTFKIPGARDIKLDRAHRIGVYNVTKTRPVVVKFNYFQDKVRVKEQVREFHLSDPNCKIKVGDQFPKAIQEKRKKLIPTLVAAKNAGKTVSLSYDKLFIDGRMYNVDTVSRAGYAAI